MVDNGESQGHFGTFTIGLRSFWVRQALIPNEKIEFTEYGSPWRNTN